MSTARYDLALAAVATVLALAYGLSVWVVVAGLLVWTAALAVRDVRRTHAARRPAGRPTS